jgi:hypothetical protein
MVVVAHQVGVELVGLALQEPVEPVEATLAGATGRTGRRPSPAPWAPGATCPRRRWRSPRRAAPRPRWRRGWRCGRAGCGNPVRKLESVRMPTACWDRPVSSDARVGEHRGVTWKLVNCSRRPPARRCSGCRCRTRSSRAGRTRCRRAAPPPRSGRRAPDAVVRRTTPPNRRASGRCGPRTTGWFPASSTRASPSPCCGGLPSPDGNRVERTPHRIFCKSHSHFLADPGTVGPWRSR